MRKRSSDVNIFSMSALDLFASALGAFILITLILFPFFPNTGDSPERVAEVRREMSEALTAAQEQLQQVQNQLSQTQGQLQQAQATINDLQQQLAECQANQQQVSGVLSQAEDELEACRIALQQTFVLVVISWDSGDDVDLHVVDPNGNEYYYAARTFPGSDASFEEDNTRGPGNEIWLSPSAMPGTYEVYANMFNKRDSGAVTVRGSLLHQNGRETLSSVSLSRDDEKPLLARFNVDNEGNVSLR